MKRTLFLLTALLLLAPVTLTAADAPCAAKPNIIFILADDLGIDGVSCYGADKRKTPNIDKLAASVRRFETYYAAPLFGPSRCALMTGRYAFRTGGISNQSWAGGGPGAKFLLDELLPFIEAKHGVKLSKNNTSPSAARAAGR